MQDATYLQAVQYKEQLVYLNSLKAELAVPATQKVIVLSARTHPASLNTVLADVESFLLSQAVTAIQDQIDGVQVSFDALQDAP